MVVCRVLPAFWLKGRDLSDKTKQVLNLIAPAAFAALVANDLFSSTMFDSGIWAGVFPLLAALIVALFAKKTKSMLGCCLVGIAVYAALFFFV